MKKTAIFSIAMVMLFASTAQSSAFYRHRHYNHYYTSSDGYRVHGPDRNHHHMSAHCGDGSISHSHHHRGTCSHHHGVAWWG